MAIAFAICCLAFSALNDFVFKLFADRPMSRGIFFAIIGVVMGGLHFFAVDMNSAANNLQNTLIWGSVAALFSIIGNILLIEAMGKLSAGICSTIYRLNLIFVVPGAMLLFGEKLTAMQLAGVIAAILAIILFSWSSMQNEHKSSVVGMLLILSASLLRAGMGLSYKYAFICNVDEASLVFINGIYWAVGGIVYAAIKDKKVELPERKTVGFGIISGLFVTGIVFFMAKALQAGAAGVVLSIAQMSFLGTLTLSVIFLKEKLEKFKVAGIVCGVAAILLLALK